MGFLWKLDPNESSLDDIFSLSKTSDGGYILGGYANTENNVNYWIIKTDSQGNKQWDKTYGKENWAASFVRNGCLQTNDGGYIIKTDGNEIWNESFGEKTDERCWSMDTTNDGGYIFCLTKNYGGAGGNKGDVWIIKIDENGNAVWNQAFSAVWNQAFSGPKEDRGYYISKTSDGGYIVAGRTESYGAGNSDGLLIKISPDKNLPGPSIEIKKPKSGHIYLFDIFGISFPFVKQAIVLGDITFNVDVSRIQQLRKWNISLMM